MKFAAAVGMKLSAVLVSVAILGCESSDAPDSSPESSAVEERKVTVALADRAAFDELIASHQGKVVLVDIWATWCLPCVKQFPHTVELSKQYDPADLVVVSVSMDEPDDEEKVLKFLRGSGASFDNLISKYGVGQQGFEAFEITDGSIPHYKVYDRTGKLRHTASSNDEIDELVQQVVSEES